jgi:hypothetical protein
LVSRGIDKVEQIDADKALEGMGLPDAEPAASAPAADVASAPEGGASGADDSDPMKALEESMKKDAAKK